MKIVLAFLISVTFSLYNAEEIETSTSVFDELFGSAKGCTDACLKIFPLHTYDKPSHLEACNRGCRLFSICEWADDDKDFNKTVEDCSSACDEAYNRTEIETTSCKVGCRSAVLPAKKRKNALMQDEPRIHVFISDSHASLFEDYEQDPFESMLPQMLRNPFRSSPDSMMQSMFNLMSRFMMNSDFMASTMNDGNSEFVIIRYIPEINTQFPLDKLVKDNTDGSKIHSKTTLVDRIIESNLQTNQYENNRPFTNDYWFADDDIELSQDDAPMFKHHMEEWWNCFVKKAGLPELALLLFWISTMILLLMCCTMQFPSKKSSTLSISGDLAYIKETKGRIPEFLKVYGHPDVVQFTEVKNYKVDEKIPLSSSF